MADNKEITTLHPYMNRNKNRYPNVREENIPDTIQRKMTAGPGINISPENVISATGGDSYTRDETDALLDTKADKVALENVNKVVPTDIAVKDGKLGLEHDTTWLTNQKAINLGDGLTYDEATKTLKASGGDKLPAGTEADPFKINNIDLYNDGYKTIFKRDFDRQFIIDQTNSFKLIQYQYYLRNIELTCQNERNTESTTLSVSGANSKNVRYKIEKNKNETDMYIPALSRPKSEGTYNLQYTYDNTGNHYDWVAGGSGLPTYNHYIVISDGTASNAIYLLIPSTNSLICSSLPELNTLLGTTNRFIQASGIVTDTASKLPIVAINWQGSFTTSKIVTMSSEELTTKFTDISDVVEPA